MTACANEWRISLSLSAVAVAALALHAVLRGGPLEAATVAALHAFVALVVVSDAVHGAGRLMSVAAVCLLTVACVARLLLVFIAGSRPEV